MEVPEPVMEFLDQNLHECRFPYADTENQIHFCPMGMWTELQTPENSKNSVLRDRDLTGKYETEVNLTNKIFHIGFSVVLNPNPESVLQNFFIKFSQK